MPPVFPSLIGLAFPIKRSAPRFMTAQQEAFSGKRARYPLRTYPTYSYEIAFNVLRNAAAYLELQTLAGFIAQVQGPAQLWAYDDPNDDTASGQQFGQGDGATTGPFQLVRTYGGFTEPVFLINGTPSVFIDQAQTVDFTIDDYGRLTFGDAPAAGTVLSWTGQFYWPCRFDDDDVGQFENFMAGLFRLKSLKFTTEKLP
jgi:hypothetical protein